MGGYRIFREFTFDLVLRASSDLSSTFQDKVNLGRYVGEISDYGQIATHGNSVFVVWSDSPQHRYPRIIRYSLRQAEITQKVLMTPLT